jgi:hypothetical protein
MEHGDESVCVFIGEARILVSSEKFGIVESGMRVSEFGKCGVRRDDVLRLFNNLTYKTIFI